MDFRPRAYSGAVRLLGWHKPGEPQSRPWRTPAEQNAILLACQNRLSRNTTASHVAQIVYDGVDMTIWPANAFKGERQALPVV